MNYSRKIYLAAVGLFVAASSAFAAPKWAEMDYGRFLTATYNNSEDKSTFDKKGCAANKGIAIKLGKDADAAILFDTDLLRVAGGWTGGFVKLKGVAYDGGHGPNPTPPEHAHILFETNPQSPGWSKGDDFKDPRKKPSGPGAADVPFGPLPSDWAKYKGLYLNGDNVVLAYSVGQATVLESPGEEKNGEVTSLTRTFNVVTKGDASNLLVAEGGDNATATLENGIVALTDPKNADKRTFIAVDGAPAGSKWQIVPPARVELKLPEFAPGQAFKIVYWSGAPGDLAKGQQASEKVAQLASAPRGRPSALARERYGQS